jgi:hypothetical protein
MRTAGAEITIAEAMNFLLMQLNNTDEKENNAKKVNARVVVYGSVILLIGAGSAYIYAPGSMDAASRYIEYIPKADTRDRVSGLKRLAAIGGGSSNGLFNMESYLTLTRHWLSPSKNRSDGYEGVADQGMTLAQVEAFLVVKNHDRLDWGMAIFMALFAVLPLWYVGFKDAGDDWVQKSITTVSAILNLPVMTDGGKSLIAWLKCFDFKDRLYDWMCSPKRMRAKNIALRTARNLMVNGLLENMAAFQHNPDRASQRTVFFTAYQQSEWTTQLIGLHSRTAFIVPQEKPSASLMTKGLFAILALGGMWGNYGYAVYSYEGGRALIDNMGWGIACAIFNLLPNLGFSAKLLKNLWQRMLSPMQSLERVQSQGLYLSLCFVIVILSLFSGFTADQMCFNGWLNYLSGDTIVANVSGLLGNIGTAITFNLPQCLLLAQRSVQLYLLASVAEKNKQVRDDITFVNGVETIASVLERMPVSQCAKFFSADNFNKDQLAQVLAASIGSREITKAQIDTIYESSSEDEDSGCCCVI